jgi:hypothetical protein
MLLFAVNEQLLKSIRVAWFTTLKPTAPSSSELIFSDVALATSQTPRMKTMRRFATRDSDPLNVHLSSHARQGLACLSATN